MKEWVGGRGVGGGGRSGPGGKEWAGGGKEWAGGKGVGRGGRSGPGGKEWAGGEGVGRGGLGCCTLCIPTAKIFYSICFSFSGDGTIPLQKLFNY